MNKKSLDTINEIYKPYKYTLKGSVIIFESTSGNYVIKDKKCDIYNLFDYLSSRSFNNYPKIIDNSRKDILVYEYLNNFDYPKEQKIEDLINVTSNLHYKTSYYKDVTEDNYKEIYETIKDNIEYLKYTYNNYFDSFFEYLYLSPAENLFMQNYSKIVANLNFCLNELDNWYDLVKNSKKARVCVNHGNLSLDHLIKNNNYYLISWDKYKIDTPIYDLVNLYKKEYFNINFENVLNNYFNKNNLSEEELKLFLLLISLPDEIKFNENEFISTLNVRENLDYIFKTEILIRPYYLKDEKEK